MMRTVWPALAAGILIAGPVAAAQSVQNGIANRTMGNPDTRPAANGNPYAFNPQPDPPGKPFLGGPDTRQNKFLGGPDTRKKK